MCDIQCLAWPPTVTRIYRLPPGGSDTPLVVVLFVLRTLHTGCLLSGGRQLLLQAGSEHVIFNIEAQCMLYCVLMSIIYKHELCKHAVFAAHSVSPGL